jgi:hypothetical protein
MDHIGIDLGRRDSQVCVRDSAGEIREEARRPTTGSGPGWPARSSPRGDRDLHRNVQIGGHRAAARE